MHRGPSNLPTPPPDNITEEDRSKPSITRFDTGMMDIDFQGDSLHSPVASSQPPVSRGVSKNIQPIIKEEEMKDTEWRKPSVDDFHFMKTLG